MSADAPPAGQNSGRALVLPNRNTIGFTALIGAMWYAGISQSNGAAFLLAFTLVGLACISIVHAWANLRVVQITVHPPAPGFAGEPLRLQIQARAARRRRCFGIRVLVRGASASAAFSEVGPDAPATTELFFRPKERGVFQLLPLRVYSLYPLGFLTAFRTLDVAQPYVVYPKAEGPLPLPAPRLPARLQGAGIQLEGDDFAGLRLYLPGEPQRHIDWKAVARGQPLLSKQWAGEADDLLEFTWDDTAGLGHEARLSQLARWVVLAERRGSSYGLAMPGARLGPARGEAHFHHCLRALATYPREDFS
ncbi:MAG: DUF58 domain-containing protein [Verrucomicrobiota bacterium]|nr:DUF58 domain-containing protein [Verrucomicrobiota bacterium]